MVNNCDLLGLFDFAKYSDIVTAIRDVLGLSEQEIHERLFHEAIASGWNVASAAAKYGITPFVYYENMASFYQETDAFIFDLVVSHQTPACQEIDLRVIKLITDFVKQDGGTRLLCLGDGIGTDSLRFASLGYNCTYFEFEGYSSAFAKYRFARSRVSSRISMVHRLEDLPFNHFDGVICREVLEHVPAPLQVVDNIRAYLKNNGIAVISESFGRVTSAYPTHLAANQQYAGKTESLFVTAGFRPLGLELRAQPFVFQKTSKDDWMRYLPLLQAKYGIRSIAGRSAKTILRLVRF